MARGMAVPISVGRNGGARLVEGSTYTKQTIMVGLTPNLSRNPFQPGDGVELGISERFVFANNTPGAAAGARRQIVRFFKRTRAAELARLAAGREGLRFYRQNAELVARVWYVELEADREDELSTNLQDALYTGPRGSVGV